LLHDHLEPKRAQEQARRIIRRASVTHGATSGAVLGLLLCLTLTACTAGRAPAPAPSPTAGPTAAATISPIATPTGPITITYWETDADDADVLLDELAAEFTKANPAITVKRVHYSYDDLRNDFRVESFNGQPPELVRAPGEFAGPFSELKIVRPLDEIFSRDFLDQYLTGALAGATTRGKLWGLPDNYGNHLMLLYNKALVTDVPQNTDAWIAQLKTLTDEGVGQYGLAYPLEESYWLIPWLAGFGGWPMDAADRPALDTLEMANALQFIYDLKATHRVVPDKADYDAAFDFFRQGKAAYIIDGTWNLERYTGLGIDVGVAPLPVVSATGLTPAPMATGSYWFMSDQAEGAALDAAARFIEFVTSADAQGQWMAKMKRLPSAKETAQSDLITDDPILAGALAQLRVARGVPPALDMACAWSGINAHLSEVMAGSRTPENAAAAMQADAEACIEEMGGGSAPPTPTK
jgi:arabinogalactan oligomer/maltooligosaccharide transport system substrate-binding protein